MYRSLLFLTRVIYLILLAGVALLLSLVFGFSKSSHSEGPTGFGIEQAHADVPPPPPGSCAGGSGCDGTTGSCSDADGSASSSDAGGSSSY